MLAGTRCADPLNCELYVEPLLRVRRIGTEPKQVGGERERLVGVRGAAAGRIEADQLVV